MHGWGVECADARIVKRTGQLTVIDSYNWPVKFIFGLVKRRSTFIIGMTLKKYSNTWNSSTPRIIKFMRTEDVKVITYTFIANDEKGC